MTKTNFSVFCNRAVDTESLQTFAYCFSSISRIFLASFNSYSSTNAVSPASVFKTNWLDSLNDFVWIKAFCFADFTAFFY
jgi:hypothetical protein